MMEEESRQLAPLTPTEISQVTKQLGLATSAEIMRASKGIAMVLDKVAMLEAQLKDLATRDVRMYPTHSEETDQLSMAVSKAKVIGLRSLKATGVYQAATNGPKTEYYTLEDFRDAFTGPLDANQLTLDFYMDQRNGIWVLVAHMKHWTSKQWKETSAELNEKTNSSRMNEDQAASSSLTYKKRDAYRLLLGI